LKDGRNKIPLCRSDFLQDITIALGRRSLKSLRQAHRMLTFAVTDEGRDGESCERLDIEAKELSGALTKIVIWEDASALIYFRESRPKRSPARVFKMHAHLDGLNAEDVAELIRATLRDFGSVKENWTERRVAS
jgi:hypothetical protein